MAFMFYSNTSKKDRNILYYQAKNEFNELLNKYLTNKPLQLILDPNSNHFSFSISNIKSDNDVITEFCNAVFQNKRDIITVNEDFNNFVIDIIQYTDNSLIKFFLTSLGYNHHNFIEEDFKNIIENIKCNHKNDSWLIYLFTDYYTKSSIDNVLVKQKTNLETYCDIFSLLEERTQKKIFTKLIESLDKQSSEYTRYKNFLLYIGKKFNLDFSVLPTEKISDIIQIEAEKISYTKFKLNIHSEDILEKYELMNKKIDIVSKINNTLVFLNHSHYAKNHLIKNLVVEHNENNITIQGLVLTDNIIPMKHYFTLLIDTLFKPETTNLTLNAIGVKQEQYIQEAINLYNHNILSKEINDIQVVPKKKLKI